jgi:hypothetical protein
MDFEDVGWEAWIGLIWLRIWTEERFHKKQGIY